RTRERAPALDSPGPAHVRTNRSDAGEADFHAVFRGESSQVLELALLHLDEELVALVAGPGQIGLGRPYALPKSCGDSVHAAPPRPGAWVDGTGVCRSKGSITPEADARRRSAGGLRCRTPLPALRKRTTTYRMVVRHKQSVIAGCKTRPPQPPFRGNLTARETLVVPGGTPVPALQTRAPTYRMVVRHKQSVIAGCKTRPPQAPFRGNLTARENLVFPFRSPVFPPPGTCPHPRRSRLTADLRPKRAGWKPTHSPVTLPARARPAPPGRTSGRTSDVRVLVVEDEQLLADAVATGLRREAMAVDVVYDGAAALERIGVNDYDVVVLARDLPLVHGDDVCRKIVELGMPTRVLMLTASGDVSDRVEGLEIGADDYLPKPFAFSELIARVRALGRRTSVPLPPVLERAGIKLDPNRREVFRDGREV